MVKQYVFAQGDRLRIEDDGSVIILPISGGMMKCNKNGLIEIEPGSEPYSEPIQVRLNSRTVSTILKTWNYQNVVDALPDSRHLPKGVIYSVMYSYPNHIDKRDGSLYPGGPSVPIVPGMLFDAYVTGNT